jgi:hypothetical protein
MAIRIRKVGGRVIAICAAMSIPKEGDFYLDDTVHYALAQKFSRDWDGNTVKIYADDELNIVEVEESNNPNREWWDKTYRQSENSLNTSS